MELLDLQRELDVILRDRRITTNQLNRLAHRVDVAQLPGDPDQAVTTLVFERVTTYSKMVQLLEDISRLFVDIPDVANRTSQLLAQIRTDDSKSGAEPGRASGEEHASHAGNAELQAIRDQALRLHEKTKWYLGANEELDHGGIIDIRESCAVLMANINTLLGAQQSESQARTRDMARVRRLENAVEGFADVLAYYDHIVDLNEQVASGAGAVADPAHVSARIAVVRELSTARAQLRFRLSRLAEEAGPRPGG